MAGLFVWRFADIAAMDLPARISLALCGGLVIVTVVMFALSLAGMRWSLLSLGLPILALGASGAVTIRRNAGALPQPWPTRVVLGITLIFLIALYGAASARITIADLLYFWGPKAAHFFHAGGIDVEFLRFPHYYLMHPDYPPLVPLAWASGALISGKVSYWGAVLVTPLILAAAALAFRGFAVPVLGRKADAFTLLLFSTLTFAAIASFFAGGGDPYLILFETVALSALTFSDRAGARALACIALAGALFTKVEGAAFVASVVIALCLTRRFRAALLSVPAFVLLATWIAFARHHDLVDSYGRADRHVILANLGLVVRGAAAQVSYGAAYLPWVAALAPLAGARSIRRAALPLLVAVASIAYTLFFYLHEPEPLWWIRSSAERVMTTTLMCFVVASAAASE